MTENDFSHEQEKLLANLPRGMAAISFLSCLYIVATVLRNPSYRSRVYHRLILGISLNVMTVSAWQFWGTAAVPVGTSNVHGAQGTTATCSAQGFLNQIGWAVPSYYCALSLHCFTTVKHNFKEQVELHTWMEKWIHTGVYVYPLASAIYLLTIDAFNYNGHICWIASVPLLCGEGTDVPCTRGPQNIQTIQLVFNAAPFLLFCFLIPTGLMVAIYGHVRHKRYRFKAEARAAAKQAFLYLMALYWTYGFGVMNAVFIFIMGRVLFWASLLAVCVENLLGLWLTIVYVACNRIPATRNSSAITTSDHLEDCEEIDFRTTRDSSKPGHVFSIFDGTNSSSRWKDYVFDGDKDDKEEDHFESGLWEGVVQS